MVDLKIATVQPIGILDEASLEPANMSSGSASAGQVLTADGAGGADWSTEAGLGDVTGPTSATDGRITVFNGTTGKAIKEPTVAVDMGGQDISNVGSVAGHVPTNRNISNGTGISGGGDLSADRTLSVNQSALDPANMSSGSATSGQLLTAGGGGAISWQDAPAAGVSGPVSSTDNALARWDSAGGDTLQDSVVTMSDTGAMVFPVAGSISKPGGTNSEAFGAGATATGQSSVAVGKDANAGANDDATACGNLAAVTGADGTAIGKSASAAQLSTSLGNSASATGVSATALGAGATAPNDGALAIMRLAEARASFATVVGYNAKVYSASSGDNEGSVAIGRNAKIGNATPGAGCSAAISIGEGATVNIGHTDAVVIGAGGASTASNRVNFASSLEVQIGQGLAAWGVTPPASQPVKVNDPSGGATIDSEARTAINSIIDILEGAGLSSAT